MLLLNIVLGTLLCGVGSVLLAFVFARALWSRFQQHLLSLAAGALLATAFLHLLPEAFESKVGAGNLFLILLMGLIFFFLLDKAELWHHGHEHGHAHGHTRWKKRPAAAKGSTIRRLITPRSTPTPVNLTGILMIKKALSVLLRGVGLFCSVTAFTPLAMGYWWLGLLL